MIYACGHEGCDICGVMQCRIKHPPKLKDFGGYTACENCVMLAVRFAYNAAATFGGTIIDPMRPCGKSFGVEES